MTNNTPTIGNKIYASIKGHFRVVLIALAFGMIAYGFIHLFIRLVEFIEGM